MVYRKLLIVHRSMVVRNLIKGYLLSELNDVEIKESADIELARNLIDTIELDLIICGQYFRLSSGPELKKYVEISTLNSSVPVLIFTSSGDERNLNELNQLGVEHVLISPFASKSLRNKVNELCDPSVLRQMPRFNIPGVSAEFLNNGTRSIASVINLSETGLLLEMGPTDRYPDVYKPIYISIRFPEEYQNLLLEKVCCRVINSKVIDWDYTGRPERLQLALVFQEMESANHQKWQTLISEIAEVYRNWSDLEM